MATNAVWKHLYGKTKYSAFLLTTQSAGQKARAQRQILLVGRSPPAVSALTTKSGLPPSLGPSICCPISSFVASLVTGFCPCTRAWMCCRQARLATLSAQCVSHYGCSEKVWRWGWVSQPTGGRMGGLSVVYNLSPVCTVDNKPCYGTWGDPSSPNGFI